MPELSSQCSDTEQLISCVMERTQSNMNTALFRDTQVSRYQKGKTNLDFNEARDSEWQWHQLGLALDR